MYKSHAGAASDPTTVDFRKLSGAVDRWRIRVGRWRFIVRLDNETGTTSVIRVLPRALAYR